MVVATATRPPLGHRLRSGGSAVRCWQKAAKLSTSSASTASTISPACTGDAVGGGGDQAGIAWNGGESQDIGERFVVELAVVALVPLPFPETVIGGDGQPAGLAQDKERGALAVAEAGEGTVEVGRGVEAAADMGV